MHGDFSRVTFAPEKHYSSVLIQQGRVQLDADANEQGAVLLHYLRTLASDLIGPFGGPLDRLGFAITLEKESNQLRDLKIGEGHYYVNGILCQSEPPGSTYHKQPDAFVTEDEGLPTTLPFLVYLRVFERHISAVEDPDIRELALGDNEPDTASRTQVVWQVVATTTIPETTDPLPANPTKTSILQAWPGWEQQRAVRPVALRARGLQPRAGATDPCITSPTAQFRGAENQLYRVEVHRGGPVGTATFKWSRDNGSVVCPIILHGGRELTLTTLGRDRRLGLEIGDWVEIVDDRYSLRNRPEPLQRVKSIDTLDLRVDLEDAPGTTTGQDTTLHPYLRRWDHREPLTASAGPPLAADNALEIVETTNGRDNWIDLEDGVQVQFQKGGSYLRGDYWLIEARTLTGNVRWPQAGGGPAALRPAGIGYHMAPLALVRGLGANQLDDLRFRFERQARPAP
jgi:Family of unknown function (DUF6519)